MKLGILGLGSIGLRHSRNALQLGAEILGYDPSAERRALLEREGGKTTPDKEEIFDCDGVVICSPNSAHRQDLAAVIKAGKSCFVEKPLSHNLDGLLDILQSADDQKLVVFSGFNLRFHCAVRQAKEFLGHGRLGTVLWARILASAYLPDWRPHQDYRMGYTADPATGGVLFDDIHEVDLALNLFGPGALAAAASRSSHMLDISAEDAASLILRHDDGTLCEIHLDYCTRRSRREFEVAGSAASMSVDLLTRRLNLTDHNTGHVDTIQLTGSFDEDYQAEMQCFLACLRGEAVPPCDGMEAMKSLNIVLAARQACNLPSS